ncbi:unnamed protein product [Hymenolepis diminuta]|uniref:Alpha-mannosidase n=1 Tax=Hymenolepis diminuta TaxID=6216 RepID=A0A0R3SR13_HYMDI|nr:unnamed protein product [Hymenolepis diminuta]
MRLHIGLWLLVLLLLVFAGGEECGYSLCPPTKDDHINVHIIPHTHDDVGWLKNIDQYYFGDANFYQTAAVQYILDSVIHALALNPNRKFTYVEMAFFERWWRLQTPAMQETVHKLVKNGQLEFALGGWSMNDEAVVHYSDSINQLTRGLAFLNATFGECGRPRVAWQIDPFGHARQQARIFTEGGFDGVFFQRMDYREKRQRLEEKTMEVLWKVDPTNNKSSLFTHMLYQSYCSPPGFCFDAKCDDPPMIVDPLATNYNAPQRVSQFLEYVRTVSSSYATNHIFVPMGCDFTYENANLNYINMDRLIEHVNAQQQKERSYRTFRLPEITMPVNLLYSSPTCYTKAVNEAFKKQGTIPQRDGDFFPYASAPNTFWTGFYTSRPTQKRMVREASSLLATCEQAHLMRPCLGSRYRYPTRSSYEFKDGIFQTPDQVVDQLRRAMGMMQHHDAVTGTEKQHVSDDYRQRLTDAMKGCNQLLGAVADTLLGKSYSVQGGGFRACENLNASVCPPLTSKSLHPDALIAVYNNLGWDDIQPWLRVPLYATKDQLDWLSSFTLTDYTTGETIPFQVVSVPPPILTLPERRVLHHKGSSELVFKPNEGLKPAGFTLYALKGEASDGYGKSYRYGYKRPVNQQRFSLEIGPDNLPLFSSKEGHRITMRFMNYDANSYYRPTSGAYVFRALSEAIGFGNFTSEIIRGELVTEVRTTFTPWAYLSARLYADDRMEVEWIVGPLPQIGRRVTEIILRYHVEGPGTLPSNPGEFYTDSMGNDLIRRQRLDTEGAKNHLVNVVEGSRRNTWNRDSRESSRNHRIEGSYFPVVNRIMIKGVQYAFAVYTDRSEGGSSLAEGDLELMLHRATTVDDGLGIVVRGIHRLVLDEVSKVEEMDVRLAQEVSRPLSLFFKDRSNDSRSADRSAKFSILTKGLPQFLHLLTVQQWPIEGDLTPKNQLLVRLQHIGTAAVGPIRFDLSGAFTLGSVTKAKEMSITANQLVENAKANGLTWPEGHEITFKRTMSDNSTQVMLQPGEVKTFILDLVKP